MLNLLKLDKRIIDYIQNIKDPRQRNYWNEHRYENLHYYPNKNNLVNFIN